MRIKGFGSTVKEKNLFKQYGETIMSNPATDLLNTRDKNNSKSHKTLNLLSNTDDKNIEKLIFTSGLDGHASVDVATANGFELFTRFAYCQALLYKAWVEASDELASKVTKSIDLDHNNSKELTSLYIDTFEKVFTNLFKSPEFASNLGKLLNSLMECIKEKDNVSKIFLSLPKIPENPKNRKRSKNGTKQNGGIKF